MTCITKLSENILFDCADLPIKGIAGSKAVLINFEDIDRSSIENSFIDSEIFFHLNSGTTGYSLEWFKDLGSAEVAFAPNSDDIDGFTHNFLARLSTSTAENAKRANELKNGRYVIVYESMYKGADSKSAFKILGFTQGLVLTEMTNNTKENSGSILFKLGTQDGTVEPYPYMIFLEEDYPISKATFDSLFANV